MMGQSVNPEPLRGLFDSYSGCLALGQTYLTEAEGQEELDLDRLESFLSARGKLLAEAERSFEALETLADPPEDDREHQVLRRQVVAILEEITGLEKNISAFLEQRLCQIDEIIRQLRRIRPAFQRYSHLGGDRADPSFITRHE